MKALFLAGGLGTRLRPLTNDLPKPMAPVMGKPLLELTIANLKKHGIDEIVLSTCYKPHKIKEYFGDGEKFRVKINYLSEDMPLGTAGAVKNAQGFFNETFLVFNADILSDIDLSALVAFHKEKGALATIWVTRVDNPSAYGVIECDPDGYITAFKEKPKPHESRSNLINAGVYVFEPELLDYIPSGRAVSIERETYPLLLEKGAKMTVYSDSFYWLDLGTHAKYLQAHRDIMKGIFRIDGLDYNQNRQYISKSAQIDRKAKLIEPVYIGENVTIGPDAVVGPETVLGAGSEVGRGAAVVGSIAWDRVVIQEGATVRNSILMSNCKVDRNSHWSNAILGENINQPLMINVR